jgi:hypothetical protein
MGTIKVTSSALNVNFTYENENLFINGSYQKDAKSDELKNISGTCRKPESGSQTGEYIGNFNGRNENGTMKYSFSDMTRQGTIVILDTIDEIEQFINGENQ